MTSFEKTYQFEVFQSRKVPEPWYLLVTFKKIRQRLYVDVEIVADWIPTLSKKFKIQGINAKNNDNVINVITKVIRAFDHELNAHDIIQIQDELDTMKDKIKEYTYRKRV